MNFGFHVNRDLAKKGSGILENIKEGIKIMKPYYDMKTCAVFVSSPRKKQIIVKESEYADMREFTINHTIIAHSTYMANVWNGDLEYILKEIDVCAQCGIQGLVIHLPKKPLADIKDTFAKLRATPRVRIYFEVPATIPSYWGKPEFLQELWKFLHTIDPLREYFGICLDTAHLWTNGIDLSSASNMREYLKNLEGISNIMVHLNDSERSLGKGPDSHMPLCEGQIWHTDQGGLYEIVKWIRAHNIITIFERDTLEGAIHDFKLLSMT